MGAVYVHDDSVNQSYRLHLQTVGAVYVHDDSVNQSYRLHLQPVGAVHVHDDKLKLPLTLTGIVGLFRFVESDERKEAAGSESA